MLFRKNCRVLSLIKNQHNEKAKTFITDNSLFNAVDKTRNTLLHYAAAYGNQKIVKFLIDWDSEINDRNKLGQTPLMRSIESDSPSKEVIVTLLDAGADINVNDNKGNNVIKIVGSSEWLNADAGRFEILKEILERGNVYFQYNLCDFELLHSGDKEDIESLLRTNVDLAVTDSISGETLVHALVKNTNPGVVELLRGRKFDINVRDNDGWTPLITAASFGYARAVEVLLSEGADVKVRASSGKPVLFVAMEEILDGQRREDAVDPEDKDTIQLLLEHGAEAQVDIDTVEFPETVPEIFWHYFNNYEFAEIYLAHVALQEALGTIINEQDRRQIESDDKLKPYFEYCRQQLGIKVCPSKITMFDLLTASEKKLERLFRNEELASKLMDFQTSIGYYSAILRKRFGKATRLVKSRKAAARIVCELMKMDYYRYPCVADEIVSYFNEQDVEYLISIQNELF